MLDVLEHVDGDDRVPSGPLREVGDDAFDKARRRVVPPERGVEPCVGLDRDDLFDAGKRAEDRGHLTDAGTDLDDLAAERRSELLGERSPVVPGLGQRGELEVRRRRGRVDAGGRHQRSSPYRAMQRRALNPSFQPIFLPSA